MQKLETLINRNSPTFKANLDRMTQLVGELRGRLAEAREGGGAKYVQRHRDQGKLPVRERIARLVDPDAPFLELSPLAGYGLYEDDTPGASGWPDMQTPRISPISILMFQGFFGSDSACISMTP
jgi:3-methylcrotonyl-CoA carboxylase beta subunit